MSLTGAFLAVFIQQWAQSYLQATGERHCPKDQARIRIFRADGLDKLDLNRVTRAVPILIHVSLFLFFSGLPVFLFNVNRTVFNVAVTWLGLCVVGYTCFTFMPIFYPNSPYYSPLSSFIWWCITNTRLIVLRLFKNSVRHDSRFCFRWPSLRAMQIAADEFALKQPVGRIDYKALLWMFQTLNEDEEFEQFFDALPSSHGSEALVDAEEELIKPNEEKLSHALIGMMDRTLLSELIPDKVKQRRIVICTKAVGATSLLGRLWTLHRVVCGEWHGFSRSVHFGLRVQDWMDMSDPDPVLAFYAQCAVAVTLSSVQKRDDHWFQLASEQLKKSKTLLRKDFANDDTILLDDVILIIRGTMTTFSGPRGHRSDIHEASSKTLKLICIFDIQNTLADLRHQFCSLWNELVDEAENNADPGFRLLCVMMLKSTRRLYLTLHENTSSSPKAFSSTTDGLHPVLDCVESYPRCKDHTDHPSGPVSELNAPTALVATPTPRLSSPPAAAGYPPYSIIPSPNFPVTPPTGALNPGVPGPYSHSAALLLPDNSRMTPRGEYVPAAMGEAYSQPKESSASEIDKGDAMSSSPASSNDTLSMPCPSIKKARTQKARRPTHELAPLAPGQVHPLSPIMCVSTPAFPGPSATSGQGRLGLAGTTPASASQPGAHVRSAPPESTTSPGIDIVPPSEPPETSPPVLPLHISPMAPRGEDVPAALDEVNSKQCAYVRLAPSEPTSTSFSESQAIDMVTPSQPESPYSATIPTPTPGPAGSTPSIDVSLGPSRTPRTATVSFPGQTPMSGGGGTMPMPSPVVGEGVVTQTTMAISPLDNVLVDAKVTMPSLGAGGAKDMAPVFKFNSFGDFAGFLYHSPHSVVYEEDRYPTALHLFEARKFLYRPDLADRIRQCERVEEVTALSQELREFVQRDWSNVALSTVSNLFSFFSFLPVFRTARVLA
jgi:hypothetical protein